MDGLLKMDNENKAKEIDVKKACTFTGHRPERLSLPTRKVMSWLSEQVEKAVEDGYRRLFMYGAIFGDILGSPYEFEEIKYDDPATIELFHEDCHITDDSVLSFAVADWLLHDIWDVYYDDEKLREKLAERFVKWTRWSSIREMAFGNRYIQWFYKAELIHVYDPINSCGNGSAMRVNPIGWAFNTIEETMRFAKLSADVTHNHPEGEKGAMCIAAAIWLARNGMSKDEIRKYLTRAFGYQMLNRTVSEIRKDCKWSCLCKDTVPMAVVAFLESEDYESAVRNAISYGCDVDTVGCMSGAIAEAFYQRNIPEGIVDFCVKRIPVKAIDLCREFMDILQE